jgi:DNA-binding NtrC family response regulator
VIDRTLDPLETLDGQAGDGTGMLTPALEILFHSDLRRVGAVTAAGLLAPRQALIVGRQYPPFHGGLQPTLDAPLDDPCISREQLSLCWLASQQTLQITAHGGARRKLALLDEQLRPLGDSDTIKAGELLRIGDRALLGLTFVDARNGGEMRQDADGADGADGVDLATSEASEAGEAGEAGEAMLGAHPTMRALRAQLAGVAAAEGTVLISGESGVGKELVAQRLHRLAPATGEPSRRPFVVVNCAAIPEQLLESELFGHRRGAFSGATSDKPGMFLAADGGTLFLDEIGELPLALQAKLLRALQERKIRPVGAVEEQPITVRVIAATNRDLPAEVDAGRFRDDLFYRLSTLTVRVPPLRERRSDVARLFVHFFGELRQRHPKLGRFWRAATQQPPPLPIGLFERLLACDWPGNVRQLRNVAQQLAVANALQEEQSAASLGRAGGGLLIPTEVEATLERDRAAGEAAPHDKHRIPSFSSSPGAQSAPSAADAEPPIPPGELDEQRLLAALEQHDYVQRRVAQALGVSHTTVDRWMRQLGLRRPKDIDRDELLAVAERHGDDVAAMARELRVSRRGLVLRLSALGIERG